MGYEVHIVRNAEWWDEEVGGGISLDEWRAYVETDKTMRLDNAAEANTPEGHVIRYENRGLAVWVAYSGHEESGNKAWFDFRDGSIVVKNPDESILRKMHQIASRLAAKVVGDDGEEYDADGRIIGDSESTPAPPVRKPWWKFW